MYSNSQYEGRVNKIGLISKQYTFEGDDLFISFWIIKYFIFDLTNLNGMQKSETLRELQKLQKGISFMITSLLLTLCMQTQGVDDRPSSGGFW